MKPYIHGSQNLWDREYLICKLIWWARSPLTGSNSVVRPLPSSRQWEDGRMLRRRLWGRKDLTQYIGTISTCETADSSFTLITHPCHGASNHIYESKRINFSTCHVWQQWLIPAEQCQIFDSHCHCCTMTLDIQRVEVYTILTQYCVAPWQFRVKSRCNAHTSPSPSPPTWSNTCSS